MIKNKEQIYEIIRYLFIGGLTTLVSLGIYYALVYTIINPLNPIELQLANICSWIGSVAFAYVTNRKFVFRSQNKQRSKELISFVGSRLLTLFIDMAIMFIGVTILKGNDKLIKLASQIIIIIMNYVLSKFLVFSEKKNRNYFKVDTLEYILFGLIPLFDFSLAFITNINYIYELLLGKVIILFILNVIRNKMKNKYLYFGIISLFMIECLFVIMKDFNIKTEIILLTSLVGLPLALTLFKQSENNKINFKFLTKIFYLYFLGSIVLLICQQFNWITINLNSLSLIYGSSLILLPCALYKTYQHKNIFTKVTGFLIIILGIFLWKSTILGGLFFLTTLYCLFESIKTHRKLKQSLLFIFGGVLILFIMNYFYGLPHIEFNLDNISDVYQQFQSSNIEEQIFGLASIDEIALQKINIELIDLFFLLGYCGFILYLIIMLISFFKLKTNWQMKCFGLIILLLICIENNILTNVSLALWVGLIINASKQPMKKTILLVSNMYPSKKFKHYGSFVKNTKEQLEALDFQVDLVVIHKHTNKFIKILSYINFYRKAFLKSIFSSYDYYYVHFVSHSTLPVILGRITSKETKLICNTHGNDIVADYSFEEKNCLRSSKVLRYADKVIAPSLYFKEVLMEKYNIDEKKIFIYPAGGVDLELFKSLDRETCLKELGLDSNYQYIGLVTRIEKDKGWDTFIDAINILKEEKFMKNVQVVIIGSGAQQEKLDNLIAQYHLEDKIWQYPFVYQKDLVKYYNAFTLCVFPTKRKSESLGLVGLEAMATKTPLIACTLYGPREYAHHEKNALTYENDTKGEVLAKRIKDYFEMSETKKKQLVENAYKTVKEYDKNKLKEKLKNIFN